MRRRSEAGFTYLGVLFMVAICSIAAAGALDLWSIEAQRDKELELLFIGNQFRQAIGLYYEQSPGPAKQYPDSINDLLSDTRFTPPRRYLRRVYRDPLVGSARWQLVRSTGGAVIGVYSAAPGTPLKQANFSPQDVSFHAKRRYSEWKFIYDKGLERTVPAVFLEVP